MRIDCALLCDAATVREGLLHLLGGGVTRVGRGVYPSPLNVTLALRVSIDPEELATEHLLEVIVEDAGGTSIGRVEVGFLIEDPGDLLPGESPALTVPVPLAQVLPSPGRYIVDIRIDGESLSFVEFAALLAS